MTFITFLVLFIKGFLYLTLKYISSLVLKTIIALSLIRTFFYVNRKQIITKTIDINDYRIRNPLYTIIFSITIIISIISTLFSFRLLNIGKSIDLYYLYIYLNNLFSTTPYYVLLVNILLIISFILLGLMFYKFIKKLIFEHFISIHIYLSQFDYWWCQRNSYHISNDYTEIKSFFTDKDDYITWKFIKYFCYDHTLHEIIYTTKYHIIKKSISLIEKHFALISLIICILYDCIFNNWILTKIYYLFPFIYLYILWRLIIRFYDDRYTPADSALSIMLYYKKIGLHQDRHKIVALYEEGVTLDDDTLIEVHDYLVNDFKYVMPRTQETEPRKSKLMFLRLSKLVNRYFFSVNKKAFIFSLSLQVLSLEGS